MQAFQRNPRVFADAGDEEHLVGRRHGAPSIATVVEAAGARQVEIALPLNSLPSACARPTCVQPPPVSGLAEAPAVSASANKAPSEQWRMTCRVTCRLRCRGSYRLRCGMRREMLIFIGLD